MAELDYYELLGVSPDASSDEIKDAYRRAVRTAHPDVGGTAGMFRLIQQAYEVLSDPNARNSYDAGLGLHEPTPGSMVDVDADPEVDVDPSFEAGAAWGTETTWDADTSPKDERSRRARLLDRISRSRFAHACQPACKLVAFVAFALCLAVLLMPDLIRPAAAEPDAFTWVLQMPLITLVVAGFYLYLAFPIEISTLEAFVLPHGLVTIGLAAWPIAYGDIATSTEWWVYAGLGVAWLFYNAALIAIALVNEADQDAERGLL